ncbi:succinylglutamate desuccinylase/aspartoacylase family protein [Falsiroseomonas oryziterrae]|uniref:succinylglutamate desuccinylase/aspartoacylase family protein n=1 Tax=Falsiroseomonas oryziterrae TaxID=2911368 RepID=UPI001F399D71|nr:succinylglutamate desuccinylase/aspartoacylase family protein [Roseomonas sp. NPKOSM-4]
MASRILCDIDLEGSGKRTGFLRLPHSTHESAYGWIPIPVAVIARGTGPTVLLSAGNHGDEYEGQIALGRLIREVEPGQVSGRLIILPAANFPAARAGRRVSPLDAGNLNRSFPGVADGTPTQQIAHFIDSVVLPMCDAAIDLHSGGSSLMYTPSALARRGEDTTVFERSLALLRAFGAPVSYIVRPGGLWGGTLSDACARRGIPQIGTELGGGGHATPAAIRVAERGLAGALRHLGVADLDWDGRTPRATRLVEVGGADYFLHAPDPGVFEPLVEPGAEVKAGQPAGLIHQTEVPWRAPLEVAFERDGLVLCMRWPGMTARGDCLFHLGTDVAA